MARRKNGILSDGSDSDGSSETGSEGGYNSQEDGDSRAERALFQHKRKRQRTGNNGKAAAWEGIFGEDEGTSFKGSHNGLGARRGKASSSKGRSDWTKPPAFVAVSAASAAAETSPASRNGATEAKDEAGSESSDDSDDSESSGPSRPPSPRIVEAEDDVARPSMASKSMMAMFGAGRTEDPTPSNPPVSSDSATEAPSAFGRKTAALKSFANGDRSNFQASGSTTPTQASIKAHDLSKEEKAHFGKIAGSFAARLLAKQGWAPGKGLGVQGDGVAVPIEAGKHLRGEGIRSGMRTEGSKREARRRGELDDEEPRQQKGMKVRQKQAPAPRDGWKKQKRIKVPVEHKSYEQLIAEGDTTRSGIGLVLDARGAEVQTVESLSELSLSTWTPTSDATQIPELRHNMRLILDVTKGDVGNLIKEGKSVNERRRWSTREEERARQKVESVSQDATRLEAVQAKVREVSAISHDTAASANPSLQPLADCFTSLTTDFKDEYKLLALDDVVVGAIDLVLRKSFAGWEPFDISSDALLSALKPWRKALNLGDNMESAEDGDSTERVMTAWESLLWHRWLPKVRSSINNDWDPTEPNLAVHLVESWETLLPTFIRDNIIDQLVLPKVHSAVEGWSGRRRREGSSDSLASIIFPWLPLLGERTTEVLDEGKRRIRSVLRKWTVPDGVLEELPRWKKDVYTSSEWDKLVGEHVLGKLGAFLRDDFIINPRNQDLKSLTEWVLPWHTLIRPSNFTRLFELEFFPKWLHVLYLWLVHPGYSGDEVARWFEMWKSLFPSDLLSNRAISNGFDAGLQLMNEAMSLGVDAPAKLQKPNYKPLPSKSSASSSNMAKASRPLALRANVPQGDITFRSLAEEFIASKDLLMLPLGKSHPSTGKPLFRVGQTIEGKGGVTVYIGEDAVFAQAADGVFRAIALDELAARASGGP